MASSSVSVSDVEHDFALASRRAKVRSARANRAVNSSAPSRGNDHLYQLYYTCSGLISCFDCIVFLIVVISLLVSG